MIQLPLGPIVAGLPHNLTLMALAHRGACFELPLKTVLEQLPTGVVRVTFGELRRGSPQTAFANISAHDEWPVDLPLGEILPKIKPAWLARRPQRRVEVPDDITSIFGAKDRPSSVTILKRMPASPVARGRVEPAAPDMPAAISTTAPPPPPTPPAPPTRPVSPITATASAPPSVPKPGAIPSQRPPSALRPAVPPPAPPGQDRLPFATTKPSPAPSPKPSFQPPPPQRAMPPVSPAMAPAVPEAAPTPEARAGEKIPVALSAISGGWPPAIRQEIAGLKETLVSLPLERLDATIKTGRLVFSWEQLKQWMVPPFSGGSEENNAAPLEVPLSLVAPRYMALRRPLPPRKRVVVPESIPGVFAGVVVSAAAPAPSAEPPPAPAVEEAVETQPPETAPATAETAGSRLGELLGEPAKADWTAREVIAGLCRVEGIRGALLASSDGLPVSLQLPEGVNGEVLAGFVPQMFSRMSQSALELQMGPVTCVIVVVEQGPCAIYQAGELYLAVLGLPKSPLPEAFLREVAAELGSGNL